MGELLQRAPVALAAPDDVDALAAAIHCARRIDRAEVRRWVVEHHSLTQTARAYVELYRQIRRTHGAWQA